MLEDADESMRGGRLAGVEWAAMRSSARSPGDLQEREIVGRVGVPAIEVLADDLLHAADAQAFRRGDGAHRMPGHEAGEDVLGADARLDGEQTGLADAGMGLLSVKR